MTSDQARLRQVADQAVRDIVELEAQVSAGEIPAGVARPLRERYENLATQAWADLDAAPAERDNAGRAPRPGALSLAYAIAAGVALVAAVVLLPSSVLDRPAGGFVSGNEAVQQAGGTPTTDPSAAVSDSQLEQVVSANPTVTGMRLALADRYVAEKKFNPAMGHYLEALRREPDNAEALAHLGWLLLQVDQPQRALDSVQQALTISPSLDDALWFRANIQLDLKDPTAALSTLRELSQRPLSPEVKDQVDQLIATTTQNAGGAG